MFEQFKRLNKIRYFLPIWLAINTLLGLLIALFLSISSTRMFSELILISQIMTHLFSSTITLTGYFLGYKLRDFPFVYSVIITNMGTLAIAALLSISVYSLKYSGLGPVLFESRVEYVKKLFFPVLIVTLIITNVTATLERLRHSRQDLKDELLELKGKGEESQEGITLQQQGSYINISFQDIIYLSSHGKRTVIHTETHGYEISQLMKDLEASLPKNLFIRVHKQFILNIRHIDRLQYYSGGRYMATMKDEDENRIPVGRTYAGEVKAKIGIG